MQTERTVAIVGASADRRKYGNKSVRAYQRAGWSVFPVNLSAERIEGLEAYRSLVDLPAVVDRVSVYLHPVDTLGTLAEIAGTECRDVWLNPGSADRRVLDRCEEIGLAVVNGCSIVDIGMSPADFP